MESRYHGTEIGEATARKCESRPHTTRGDSSSSAPSEPAWQPAVKQTYAQIKRGQAGLLQYFEKFYLFPILKQTTSFIYPPTTYVPDLLLHMFWCGKIISDKFILVCFQKSLPLHIQKLTKNVLVRMSWSWEHLPPPIRLGAPPPIRLGLNGGHVLAAAQGWPGRAWTSPG